MLGAKLSTQEFWAKVASSFKLAISRGSSWQRGPATRSVVRPFDWQFDWRFDWQFGWQFGWQCGSQLDRQFGRQSSRERRRDAQFSLELFSHSNEAFRFRWSFPWGFSTKSFRWKFASNQGDFSEGTFQRGLFLPRDRSRLPERPKFSEMHSSETSQLSGI